MLGQKSYRQEPKMENLKMQANSLWQMKNYYQYLGIQKLLVRRENLQIFPEYNLVKQLT